MGIKFTNNAVSSIVSSLEATSTTIVVKSGDGSKFSSLPNINDYQILVLSDGVLTESVKVTSRSGDSLTVVRGYEGVARPWSVGAKVIGAFTAAVMSDMLTNVTNDVMATIPVSFPEIADPRLGDNWLAIASELSDDITGLFPEQFPNYADSPRLESVWAAANTNIVTEPSPNLIQVNLNTYLTGSSPKIPVQLPSQGVYTTTVVFTGTTVAAPYAIARLQFNSAIYNTATPSSTKSTTLDITITNSSSSIVSLGDSAATIWTSSTAGITNYAITSTDSNYGSTEVPAAIFPNQTVRFSLVFLEGGIMYIRYHGQQTGTDTRASLLLRTSDIPVDILSNAAAPPGTLAWDTDNGTAGLKLTSDVILQLGQESHLYAKNVTGSTLNNGSVVYISGGSGTDTLVSLAQANSTIKANAVIGVVTESITNSTKGYVTTYGYVNDIDTSSFSAGDVLWLSPTVSGGLTNVRPVHPYYAVRLGYCIVSNASTGKIYISPQKYADPSDILLPAVGTPTDTLDVLDWFNHSWSTGMTDGGDITNTGTGSVNIAASDILLRQGINSDSPLVVYRDGGTSGLSIPDNEVSYVYVNYNAGIPAWQTSSDISAFNGIDKVIVYVIARNGSRLNIIDLREINVDTSRKQRRQQLEFTGYSYNGWYRSSLGTSSVSSSGLNLIVAPGKYYFMNNPFNHAIFNTTTAGAADANNFIYFYSRTGSWTQLTGQKTINNTQYDNAGVLTTLNNNKYRTDWVYVVMGDPSPYIVAIMGNTEHATLTDAQASELPNLPPQLEGAAILLGQVCVLKSDTTITIRNAGSVSFSASSSTLSHSALLELTSSDDHTQYALAAPTAAPITYVPSGTTIINLTGRYSEVYYSTVATAGTTWSFTNPSSSGTITKFRLELTNGGLFTQTFSASVKWPAGVKPTFTSAGLDILEFYTRDGGTTWRGSMLAQDSK